MGRIALEHAYADSGVTARVDGEVTLKLSPKAFSGGNYAFDTKLVGELRRLAAPGRDFLDAGAHVGIASLLYAKFAGEGARILAFEPNPSVYTLLVENNRVNGSRLQTLPVALGRSRGESRFYADGRDPNASLSADAPGKYWYWENREKPAMRAYTVPITTIDAVCDAFSFRPGVIKLDVEGAELHVIEGGAELIKRERPIILMETHVFAWESFGYTRENLKDAIDRLGYRICDEQGMSFDGALGDGPQRDNNHFILVPPPC